MNAMVFLWIYCQKLFICSVLRASHWTLNHVRVLDVFLTWQWLFLKHQVVFVFNRLYFRFIIQLFHCDSAWGNLIFCQYSHLFRMLNIKICDVCNQILSLSAALHWFCMISWLMVRILFAHSLCSRLFCWELADVNTLWNNVIDITAMTSFTPFKNAIGLLSFEFPTLRSKEADRAYSDISRTLAHCNSWAKLVSTFGQVSKRILRAERWSFLHKCS